MKFTKLALASVAAFGLAGVASADTYYVQDGLEWGQGAEPAPKTGVNEAGGINPSGGEAVWFGGADTDETAVTAYDGNLPAEYKIPTINGNAMTAGDYYLKVSNSSPLWRLIKEGGYSKDEGTGDWPTDFPTGMDVAVPWIASAADAASYEGGLFIDTLVQFTPSEDPPETDEGSKLVVWMNTNGVLCVTAKSLALESETVVQTKTDFETTKAITTNTWYRLTVAALNDVCFSSRSGATLHGFIVYIDGSAVAATEAAISADVLATSAFTSWCSRFTKVWAAIGANQFFPSLDSTSASASLAAVGFRGEGLVDDIVVSDVLPTFTGGASGIDFTLTWDEGVSAVWYAVGGTTNLYTGTVDSGLTAGQTVAYGGDWGVPGEITLADGSNNANVALATTGGAAGVEGGLAGFTAAQLKAAFPDASPADINSAANAYLDYQFGQELSTLSAAPTLKIAAIDPSATAGYWDIKVQVLNGETPMAIDNGSEAEVKTPLRAALMVCASDTLTDFSEANADAYALVYDDATTDLTVKVPAADGQFFKAYIKYAVPAND